MPQTHGENNGSHDLTPASAYMLCSLTPQLHATCLSVAPALVIHTRLVCGIAEGKRSFPRQFLWKGYYFATRVEGNILHQPHSDILSPFWELTSLNAQHTGLY
ncbi:hypothetical protein BsWGS_15836 [Bradybaena similaris]